MSESKPQGHGSVKRSPCEINRLFGGSPCTKAAREDVDGLALCERHALQTKLEGQISCWDEVLFHVELWIREASRRERPDVVRLIEDQCTRATSARHRAYENLDALRRSEMPRERREEPPTTRGSLLVLPPKAAPRLSPGLGRLRRR